METSFQPTQTSRPHRARAYILGCLAVVCIASLGAVAYWQYQRAADLSRQLGSATTAKNNLLKDKTTLTAKNGELTNIVQTLQAQVTALHDQNTIVQPPAAGSMTITAVKKVDAATFSTQGETALTGQVLAIYVTFTNLTTSNQQYTVFDFSAITDTGEAVHPRVYPGPAGQGVWNNSTLAPNGSKSVALLFDPSLAAKSLVWTPAGGSASIVQTLPALAN